MIIMSTKGNMPLTGLESKGRSMLCIEFITYPSMKCQIYKQPQITLSVALSH